MRFFGFETRCKIYLESTPKPTKAFIWLYWRVSNFGQSIVRPLIGILLCLYFATATTQQTYITSPALNNQLCETVQAGQSLRLKSEASWRQSVDVMLPFLTTDRQTKQAINQCLYGKTGVVPWQNNIINGIQQVFTLVFLFLLGLAIRNRFKIK